MNQMQRKSFFVILIFHLFGDKITKALTHTHQNQVRGCWFICLVLTSFFFSSHKELRGLCSAICFLWYIQVGLTGTGGRAVVCNNAIANVCCDDNDGYLLVWGASVFYFYVFYCTLYSIRHCSNL